MMVPPLIFKTMKRHLVVLGVFLLRNVEKWDIMKIDFRGENQNGRKRTISKEI